MAMLKIAREQKPSPPKITPQIAEAFFDALDGNEENMGEGAALAVTLEQFGYGNWEMDVLAKMAEALRDTPE